MERMDEEETLEGAGHWEQRRSSSSQRTPGTRIILDHSMLSSHLLWSSPFPIPKLIAEQWFYWNFTCTQYCRY